MLNIILFPSSLNFFNTSCILVSLLHVHVGGISVIRPFGSYRRCAFSHNLFCSLLFFPSNFWIFLRKMRTVSELRPSNSLVTIDLHFLKNENYGRVSLRGKILSYLFIIQYKFQLGIFDCKLKQMILIFLFHKFSFLISTIT